jgi:hypothetical protein
MIPKKISSGFLFKGKSFTIPLIQFTVVGQFENSLIQITTEAKKAT